LRSVSVHLSAVLYCLAAALGTAAAHESASQDVAELTAPYLPEDGQTQAFKQLIYDAIAAHPRVRSAFARRGQASADRDAAKAALRPQLSVEMQGRASLASDFGNDFDNLVDRSQSSDDARASLVARQLLFDGGAASGRVKAAGFSEDEASANARAEISDFTLSAIGTYYDVVRYRMVQDLMEGNVERHQTLLDDIRSRLRQGVAGARDEARGEARLADARARLVAAERKLEEARSSYVAIFDQSPVLAVLPALPFDGLPDRHQVEDRALNDSPMLEAALNRNEAKAAEFHAAKVERYIPSLSVELRGTRYNIGESGEDYDVSAILAVNYALYSGGLKSARENRA
jgi:adhesin transport system outer membrane protein